MKPILIAKLSIDILMTVLYLAMMGLGLMKSQYHEMLGILVFALFVVHHLLNLNWYRSLRKGKWPTTRKMLFLINMLLTIVMVGMAVNSVLVSWRIFPFDGGLPARRLHAGLVNWGFILISAHVGFHWEMIMGLLQKKIKGRERPEWSMVLRLLALMIAAYGAFAFYAHEVGFKLILYYGYSFWDFENKAVLFFVDYICIMGLFIYLTHQTIKRVKASSL